MPHSPFSFSGFNRGCVASILVNDHGRIHSFRLRSDIPNRIDAGSPGKKQDFDHTYPYFSLWNSGQVFLPLYAWHAGAQRFGWRWRDVQRATPCRRDDSVASFLSAIRAGVANLVPPNRLISIAIAPSSDRMFDWPTTCLLEMP